MYLPFPNKEVFHKHCLTIRSICLSHSEITICSGNSHTDLKRRASEIQINHEVPFDCRRSSGGSPALWLKTLQFCTSTSLGESHERDISFVLLVNKSILTLQLFYWNPIQFLALISFQVSLISFSRKKAALKLDKSKQSDLKTLYNYFVWKNMKNLDHNSHSLDLSVP